MTGINSAAESAIDTGNTPESQAHYLKRGVEGAVLVAEVTPINEALRVAAGGAAIAAGADPLLVAGVYGSATMVIEGGAAMVAASWLTTERSSRTVDWFNEKMESRGISSEAKFSKVTKAAIAFLGGSAISSAVKYREEPDMQKNEVRAYGVKTAAMLSGACAVQGYFVAQGIDTPNALTIGGGLAAVGSIAGLYKWAKKRVNKEEAEQSINPENIGDESL